MVIRLRLSPPDGWEDAKCLDVPVSRTYDPFFGIEYDQEGNEVNEDEAKAHAIDFCNGTYDGNICPVREQCLIFALTNNLKEGIWGGTSEITRKAIRRKHRPNRNGTPNKEWKWQTESASLEMLKKEQPLAEKSE